jgi:WS/DGAT/MGAT family acyltransferase
MANDTAGGLATDGTIGFMNGLDALFLYLESPETPMHIGSMHLFELPTDWQGDFAAAVRHHIASRLDLADVFTRRIARMPLGIANPAWVRAAEIDMDHHVRRLRLPEPGTLAQLHDAVGSLHARLLDRQRPLWEMVVIEGLASGHIAFYAKVHHAGLDGQAGVALAAAVYDLGAGIGLRPPAGAARAGQGDDPAPAASPGPAGARAQPDAGRLAPGALAVMAAGLRNNASQLVGLGARLPALVRQVAAAMLPSEGGAPGAGALLGGGDLLAPRTVLNGAISRHRSFATVSVPLAGVRALAQRHDASVNDVVLAACGGALREWLEARGELPAATLLAAVPVSLRRSGDTQSNTQAMMSRMPLATDVADPIERLLRIRDASRRIKGALRDVRSSVPTEFPSLGLPWLGGLLAAIWGRGRLADRLPPIANVLVSNVPGPPVPMYLIGARMLGYWPVSIPTHGLALNITVQSYAGSLDFGLIACRRTVPDVDAIALRIGEAFEALRTATGPAERTAEAMSATPAPRVRRRAAPGPRSVPVAPAPRARRRVAPGTEPAPVAPPPTVRRPAVPKGAAPRRPRRAAA